MTPVRTLIVGSDHAAIPMRQAVAEHLEADGWIVVQVGPSQGERSDYPDQAAIVGRQVASGDAECGILICGTGIGVSIAANKVPGIRAALVHDPVTAALAAQHNRANVLCLGGRLLALPYALSLIDTWLNTDFESRHQHRLDKIDALDRVNADTPAGAPTQGHS